MTPSSLAALTRAIEENEAELLLDQISVVALCNRDAAHLKPQPHIA